MLIYTFINKRNPHKKLEIHCDGHRHYSVRPYMEFENGVVNRIGDGKLHRWRKENLYKLLEDYEETTFDDCLVVACSYCNKYYAFLMNPQERKLREEYCFEKSINEARQMGFIQDLFPRVPAFIRSGAIDRYANGFCVCPKCQKGE